MKKTLILLVVMLFSVVSFGQKLPFQGKLIENGQNVEGTHSFVFEITELGWSETHNDVTVTDGLYFVVLGSINPLPDSLFYGVTERYLNISVDGTFLTSVTLFKPLSSPFEGNEITVKNSAGYNVGKLAVAADTVGEYGLLELTDPLGKPNILLGAIGETGNNGEIHLKNANEESTVILSSDEKAGSLKVKGQTLSEIDVRFYEDSNGNKELPSISLFVDSFYYARLSTVKVDTSIFGRLTLSSKDESWNIMRSDAHFLYKNGIPLSQYRIQDWGGIGHSAFLDLRGPNSTNIEMTSKHWVNADLPWFKLVGSQNQDAIQMSVYEDSTETAYINLFSLNQKESFLTTNSLVFKDFAYGQSHLIDLGTNNNSGNGSVGYLNLSGPNSTNIWLGSRDWESSDLPQINLHGNDNFHGMEISVAPNQDGIQHGFINLWSENGNSLQLSPFNFGIEKVKMFNEPSDSNKTGHIHVLGPNTLNISMGGKHWENNADLPYLHFFGTNDGNGDFHAIDVSVINDQEQSGYINLADKSGRSLWASTREMKLHNTNGSHLVRIGINNDEQNNEWGAFELGSYENKLAYIDSRRMALIDVDNTYRDLANLFTHNYSGNGWSGNLNLFGPNSINFEVGAHGDEPDRAFLNMNGASNENRVHISIDKDAEGIEKGTMSLISGDSIALNLSPDGINLDKISINRLSNENGVSSEMLLWGNNSPNVQLGSQWGNSNLGYFQLITDKPDGNGGFFEGVRIQANSDSTDSWGSMILFKNQDWNIIMDGNSGNISIAGNLAQNSDIRLKRDIVQLTGTLNKLKEIRGVSYFWKKDKAKNNPQIGLIAQEVEKVYPELVATKDDGFKTLNYPQMVSVLVEAVKELNEKVEKLKNENLKIEAQLQVSQKNTLKIEELEKEMKLMVEKVMLQMPLKEKDNNSTSLNIN